MKWIIIAFALVILISGCVSSNDELPSELCISSCSAALERGEDLGNGPCLLDPIAETPSWVCDVAHSPRTDIDNDPANQCSEYGKTASHFVEVDESCEVIRVY